jgi:FtsH-binding integral membrane protein
LTTLLAGLFLTGNLFKLNSGETSEIVMNFKGLYEVIGGSGLSPAGKILPVTIVSLLIPLISLISVFLFRNRNLQLKVTLTLIILEILLIAVTAYYTVHFMMHSDASLIPGFRLFLPVITVILTLLAYRAIRKDENLVRSYDRLR